MRIDTWNINGYRAALQKGSLNWLTTEAPDILCLQEVKAREEQIPAEGLNFTGYQYFWNAADRPGYSGVAAFTKITPVEVGKGLDDPRFDNEGRVIWMKFPEFVLYNIYFPNGQRGKERVDYKLDFYARLLDICDTRHKNGENIILTGDFNTAHTEMDLANPRENAETSGFLPEERAWVTKYLENGFCDIFREQNPEKVQYTWWTYRMGARQRNIGWRIDYFLISRPLIPQVERVEIFDQITGSDHCPVSLFIRI